MRDRGRSDRFDPSRKPRVRRQCLRHAPREKIVGSCCYHVNASTNFADVAFIVHPGWQGAGLASIFLGRMADYARRHGVRGFTADVLCQNERMLAVFKGSGLPFSSKVVSGSFEVSLLLDPLGNEPA